MRALVATDGEAPAGAALTLLERLGDRSRLEVAVLCVATFDLALEAAGEVGHYAPDEARRVAGEVAGRGAGRLRAAGFVAEPLVADGDPTVEILRRLEEEGFDLAVMGGGKRRLLDQLLLGSVSTAILSSSPRPVLVVRRVRENDRVVRVLVGADGSDDAVRATRTFADLADPARSSAEVLTIGGRHGSSSSRATPPRFSSTTSSVRARTSSWRGRAAPGRSGEPRSGR
jgi:nucleotide-binding universal stress UspA family protein